MFTNVIQMLLKEESHFTNDLESVNTLPKVFDSIMLGYQQDFQTHFRQMVDDVISATKCMAKSKEFNDNSIKGIEITVSFITYLLYYKYPLHNDLNLDFQKIAKRVSKLYNQIKTKIKDVHIHVQKIFACCISVLSSLNISILKQCYDVIFDIISTLPNDSKDLQLDIIGNLNQIPYLLKIILNKRQTQNSNIMRYLVSLICRITKKIPGDAKMEFEFTKDKQKAITNFYNNVRHQKQIEFRQASALVAYIFIPNSFNTFTLEDYMVISSVLPKILLYNAYTKHSERLLSCLIDLDFNSDMIDIQDESFLKCLTVVLIKCSNNFPKLFQHINESKVCDELIPKLSKRVFSYGYFTYEYSILYYNKPESKQVRVLDDPDEIADPILCKIGFLIMFRPKSKILDYAANSILSKTYRKSAALILDSIAYFSPDNLRSLIQRFTGMYRDNYYLKWHYDSEDEDDSESSSINDKNRRPKLEIVGKKYKVRPSDQLSFVILCTRIWDILKAHIQKNFTIPELIPEVVSFILSNRESYLPFPDKCVENQAQLEEILKLLSLIALFGKRRKDENQILKDLGFESGSLDQALISFASSSEQAQWKESFKELMEYRFNTLLFNLGLISEGESNIDYPKIDGLKDKNLKSAIIGYFILPQSSKCKFGPENLAAVLSKPWSERAVRLISESLVYLNASEVSFIAHNILKIYIKSLDSEEGKFCRPKDAFMYATSVLKYSKWDKNLLIACHLKYTIDSMCINLYEENQYFADFLKILDQIVSIDKYHALDDQVKENILETLIENQNVSAKCQTETIHIITNICNTIDFNNAYRDDVTGSIALSHVPGIFDLIDKCIKSANSVTFEAFVDAIVSVCGFYKSAFRWAVSKLLSVDQRIFNTYLCALAKYLETHESAQFDDNVTAFDLLTIEQKYVIGALAQELTDEQSMKYLGEGFYSAEFAEKIITRLLNIQVEYFDKKLETFDSVIHYSIMIVNSYLKAAAEKWINEYYQKGIFQKIIDLENIRKITHEEQMEFIHDILNHFNGFVETIPPTLLKVAYHFSTLADGIEEKRIRFQWPIFVQVFCPALVASPSKLIRRIGKLILMANAQMKCKEKPEDRFSSFDNDAQKIIEKVQMTVDEYHEIVGIIAKLTVALFVKAKELYEKEGLKNMWYKKNPQKEVYIKFQWQLGAATENLVSNKVTSEEYQQAINHYLKILYKFSIDTDFNLPERWGDSNSNPMLKILHKSSKFAKVSETVKSSEFMSEIRTSEEKKWFFIALNLILASKESINKAVSLKLIKMFLKNFGIECRYQIPTLEESFSGRIDSISIKISEGLAEANSDSANVFLKQFTIASKLLGDKNLLSTISYLSPWAAIAGKNHDDQYIANVFDSFIELFPDLEKQDVWARSGSAISDILNNFSKESDQSIEEILSNELSRISVQCLPEEKKRANMISRYLIIYLNSNNNPDKSIYPSLLHSCIIGTVLYNLPASRSLLRFILRYVIEIEPDMLNYIEDNTVDGYNCILQTISILTEGKGKLSEFIQPCKELFLNDMVVSPIDTVMIIGWLFASVFVLPSELPQVDHKFDRSLIKTYYKELSDISYGRAQVEEFIMKVKPYHILQRLTRFNVTHPKELNDILIMYLKKYTGLRVYAEAPAEFIFNEDFGDFATSFVIGLSSAGRISLKKFEAKAFKELFSYKKEVWSTKAVPLFIYLIATRSELLSEFIMKVERRGKLAELIFGITNFNFNVDIRRKPDNVIEFLRNDQGSLGFVVNNIIDFITEGKFIPKKISTAVLTHMFTFASFWLRTAVILPNTFWKIYLIVSRQPDNRDFVDLIEEVLKWKDNMGTTTYVNESMVIIEQITRILNITPIKHMANYFEVYDNLRNEIEMNFILSYQYKHPVSECNGALFVFGLKRLIKTNINIFNDMFIEWINTKGSNSVIKEIFTNEPVLTAQELLTNDRIYLNAKCKAITWMAQSKKLNEEEAGMAIEKLNELVDQKSMADWCKLVYALADSDYLSRKELIPHLLAFFEQIILITRKDNIKWPGIIENIKNDTKELYEKILPSLKDDKISEAISNILEGKKLTLNSDMLIYHISRWKAETPEMQNDFEFIDTLMKKIKEGVNDYEKYEILFADVTEACVNLATLLSILKAKKPKKLSEELQLRTFVQKVLELARIAETELPGFNQRLVYEILQNVIKSKPEVFIPIMYSAHNSFSPIVKESVSIISHLYIDEEFKPITPILTQILEEDDFVKLFDESLSIEDIIEIISYLASTQMLDKLVAVADKKLSNISSLSENVILMNFFSALLCFLLRPLCFCNIILDALKEGDVNDIFTQAYIPEKFLIYFNKLTASDEIKKELIVTCFLKPLLKNPELYLAKPMLTGYNYDDLDFSKLRNLDDFLESVKKKEAVSSVFKYERAEQSRKSVIQILKKDEKFEPDYESENEEQRFFVDYEISSEFSVFSKIAYSDPILCLSFLQMKKKNAKPIYINTSGPNIEVFIDFDYMTSWRYSNLISSEDEIVRLCHFLISRCSHPKVSRDLISLLILKYPKCVSRTLINGFLDIHFRRNIDIMTILRKGPETRPTSQMRLIRLLYQIAQISPGIFSDNGTYLVAYCVLSMINSPFKWVKYVRGLISQYVDNIEARDEEHRQNINEKKDALLKSINEGERHLLDLVQLAYEMFGAIGEEEQKEFVSLFNSYNPIDYKFIYIAGIAAVIKLDELGVAPNESLRTTEKVDAILNNVLSYLSYSIDPDDDDWPCYFCSVLEVLTKLIAFPISPDKTKIVAWLALVCSILQFKKCRIAALVLLRLCIEKLSSAKEIEKDSFLSRAIKHPCLAEINEKFHMQLIGENKKDFVSLFAIFTSVVFEYGDEETINAATEMLNVAWAAFKRQTIESLYVLLPALAYSQIEPKRLTWKPLKDKFCQISMWLEDFDFRFMRSYMRCVCGRCPSQRFALLCPNDLFPIDKEDTYEKKKDSFALCIPNTPEMCHEYFLEMVYGIEQASRASTF